MNSKIDNWRSIFADWEVSGLSQREYCRVKGIVYSTFIGLAFSFFILVFICYGYDCKIRITRV